MDPGNAAELDAFLGQRLRFFVARLAIDAMRIDFAVMNAARLLGKALAEGSVRTFACFPLIPFSNRIANATLRVSEQLDSGGRDG